MDSIVDNFTDTLGVAIPNVVGAVVILVVGLPPS